MSFQSAINKEVFLPRGERVLVAVEVWRRKRKRMSFLPVGARGEYSTFICVSVTDSRPPQLLLTKVKRFAGSAAFVRRSQWSVEQLRQVNGINPNKDSPDFDLVFDDTVDQWVAGSAADKCLLVHILYRACQTYWEAKTRPVRVSRAGQQTQFAPNEPAAAPRDAPTPRTLQARRRSLAPPRRTQFINCQAKLTADASTLNLLIFRCKAFLNRMKSRMAAERSPAAGRAGGPQAAGGTLGNVVQRMTVSLGERGDRLSRAEDRTVELLHKAQRLADSAHMLALKHSK